MKLLKVLLIVILSLLFVYTIFIVEESIRIKNNVNSKPIIILDRTKCSPSCASIGNEITLEYYGIGYKLNITYYHSKDSSNDNQIYQITREELYLFNKVLLWGWVI